MQSRTESLKEACVIMFWSMVTSLVSQLVIFRLLNVDVSIKENLIILLWFTAISIIRNYIIRRYFNRKIKRKYYENY